MAHSSRLFTLAGVAGMAAFAGLSAWAQSANSEGLIEEPVMTARKLMAAGKMKEAMDFVEPLVQGREKKNAALLYSYAQLLKRSGRTDEAIAQYEEVLRLAPYGWMETYSKQNLAELRSGKGRGASASAAGPNAANPNAANPNAAGMVGIALLSDRHIGRVFKGTPASAANLLAGDLVASIDGVSTVGMSQDEMVKRISGPIGSKVSLVIERGGKQYAAPLTRTEPSDLVAFKLRERAAMRNGNVSESASGAGGATSSADCAPPRNSARAQAHLLPGDPPITVFRHTSDSDAMREVLVTAMCKLPVSLRRSLAEGGLKLTLTPSLLDSMPELATERPRGYIHGGNFTNCGGLYRGGENTVYVTERVAHGSGVPHLNTGLDHTFFHEFGHAVDHATHISTSNNFMEAYHRDCGHLTNGVRDHFHYFTQEGQAGPAELFAQLFYCAVEGADSVDTNDLNLTRTFPECFKIAQSVLANG